MSKGKTQNISLRWNENGYFFRKYHPHKFTQTDTLMARLYGLAKTHKLETDPSGDLLLTYDENGNARYKLRPVLSTINTPPHFIAQFLNKLLKTSIRKPRSHVVNSYHFIQDIKNIYIPDAYVLISLNTQINLLIFILRKD